MTIQDIIRDFNKLQEKFSFIESLLHVRSNNVVCIRIKLPYVIREKRYLEWEGDFEDFKRDINILKCVEYKYQTIIQAIVPESPKYFYIKYLTRNKVIKVKIINEYFKPSIFDRLMEFIFF